MSTSTLQLPEGSAEALSQASSTLCLVMALQYCLQHKLWSLEMENGFNGPILSPFLRCSFLIPVSSGPASLKELKENIKDFRKQHIYHLPVHRLTDKCFILAC